MITHNLDRNIYRLRIFSKANVICKIGSLCLAFAISLSSGIAANTTPLNEKDKKFVGRYIAFLKNYNFETKKFEYKKKTYEKHTIVNFFNDDKREHIRTDFIEAILNDSALRSQHLQLISGASSFNTTLQKCLPTPKDIFKYKSKLYSEEDSIDLREHILDTTYRDKGWDKEYDYFLKHVKDKNQWEAIADLIPTWITIQELVNSLKKDREKVLSFIRTHIGKIAQNSRVNKKAKHEQERSIDKLVMELFTRGEYLTLYSFSKNGGISKKIKGLIRCLPTSSKTPSALIAALSKEVDERPDELAAFLTAALSRDDLGNFANKLARNGFYKAAIFVFKHTDAIIPDPYYEMSYLSKIIGKEEGQNLVLNVLLRAKKQEPEKLKEIKNGLEELLGKVTESESHSKILSDIFKKVDETTVVQNNGFLTMNSLIGVGFILICAMILTMLKLQQIKKKKQQNKWSSNPKKASL